MAHEHIEFSATFPDSASTLKYGTIELRAPSPTEALQGVIQLGHVESLSIKSTGEEQELPDESGDTQHYLMLNIGEEATVRCRFMANRTAPRKGWFFRVMVPRAENSAAGNPPLPANLSPNTALTTTFLITDVEFLWEEKGIRKYVLTGKRWSSLNADAPSNAPFSNVIDAAGAVDVTPESKLIGVGNPSIEG